MLAAAPLQFDAVIFGGGAAGLWLLDELVRNGYQAIVIEREALGSGQTIASQGIIHGGLKYTLDGLLRGSAAAIREMPALWRECMAGRRAPDLRETKLRADHCYLWRTDSVASRLAMIGAKVGLNVRPRTVEDDERPAVLADCPGAVAIVDEPVIDPPSLLAALAHQRADQLVHAAALLSTRQSPDGDATEIQLKLPGWARNDAVTISARHVILGAGEGNAALRRGFGLNDENVQQLRPLHMVMLRGTLPMLNGHCVDGARTRVTITTATDSEDRTVWQVGGQLAEDGASMESRPLIEHARVELHATLPGIDLRAAEWATYRVNRAEPATATGARPDDAFAVREGRVITAWPTKLALVPRLVERVVQSMDGPAGAERVDMQAINWPRPRVAQPPWETCQQWSSGV